MSATTDEGEAFVERLPYEWDQLSLLRVAATIADLGADRDPAAPLGIDVLARGRVDAAARLAGRAGERQIRTSSSK